MNPQTLKQILNEIWEKKENEIQEIKEKIAKEIIHINPQNIFAIVTKTLMLVGKKCQKYSPTTIYIAINELFQELYIPVHISERLIIEYLKKFKKEEK